MENGMEHASSGAAERPELQRFVVDRGIQAEDLPLIDDLASYPENLVVTVLHNVFNVHKDRSGDELEHLMQTAQDADVSALCGTMLAFYKKYGWATSLNLVRVLEGEI